MIATLVGFTETGAPLVSPVGARIHTSARSCVPLGVRDIGKQLVAVFNDESPIVIGLIQPRTAVMPVEVTADGRDVVVNAEESITLKCGDASITLNRDGKIVIRGRHVVTHASGVNRIRGGSVQLN